MVSAIGVFLWTDRWARPTWGRIGRFVNYWHRDWCCSSFGTLRVGRFVNSWPCAILTTPNGMALCFRGLDGSPVVPVLSLVHGVASNGQVTASVVRSV